MLNNNYNKIYKNIEILKIIKLIASPSLKNFKINKQGNDITIQKIFQQFKIHFFFLIF